MKNFLIVLYVVVSLITVGALIGAVVFMCQALQLIPNIESVKDSVVVEETTQPETTDRPTIQQPETAVTDTPSTSDDPFAGIEPLCIWNMNGIKISILGLEMNGKDGPEMYIEIRNRTDKDIIVGAKSVKVNDCRMDPEWCVEVASGETRTDTIKWYFESCVENNITDILTVEAIYKIVDADTWVGIIDTPSIRVEFEDVKE